eukprot:1193545-Prorocentrum_minimum.AAC.1
MMTITTKTAEASSGAHPIFPLWQLLWWSPTPFAVISTQPLSQLCIRSTSLLTASLGCSSCQNATSSSAG